jgi:hypothetical protein
MQAVVYVVVHLLAVILNMTAGFGGDFGPGFSTLPKS